MPYTNGGPGLEWAAGIVSPFKLYFRNNTNGCVCELSLISRGPPAEVGTIVGGSRDVYDCTVRKLGLDRDVLHCLLDDTRSPIYYFVHPRSYSTDGGNESWAVWIISFSPTADSRARHLEPWMELTASSNLPGPHGLTNAKM